MINLLPSSARRLQTTFAVVPKYDDWLAGPLGTGITI
jgi:hypothetical protein